MTPEHAKKLYRALSDNLSKYENHMVRLKKQISVYNSIKFWRPNNTGLENYFLKCFKGS